MPSIKGAASDEMLHHYVRELAGAPAGHRAIWLRLSRLDPSYRREKHVQIACRVVEELIKHFTGRVFVRPNGDVVLISQEMKDKVIRHTAELLRNVFGGDAAQHGAADQLCAIYDLESDYPRFVSALLAAMQPEKAAPRAAAAKAVQALHRAGCLHPCGGGRRGDTRLSLVADSLGVRLARGPEAASVAEFVDRRVFLRQMSARHWPWRGCAAKMVEAGGTG
jgi:hypothetical protein